MRRVLGTADPLPGFLGGNLIRGATSIAYDGRQTLWVTANDSGSTQNQLVQVLMNAAGGLVRPHRLVGTNLVTVASAGTGNVYAVDTSTSGTSSGAVVNFNLTTGSAALPLGVILPGALAVTDTYIWLIDLIQGQLVRVTR